MPLTPTTHLSLSGAGMPTAYTDAAARGQKSELGRLQTWDFQVTAAGIDKKVKFQTTSDDPDVSPGWSDLVSTRLDTGVTATEHTIAAGSYTLRVATLGTRSIRPLGIATGASAGGDTLIIKSALPLAGA